MRRPYARSSTHDDTPPRRKPLGADSPFYHWWITAALMLGFTTAGLSVTVVQLAFPHIMTSLRTDLDTMQWVQTSSMIMQAVMMPSVAGSARGWAIGGSICCPWHLRGRLHSLRYGVGCLLAHHLSCAASDWLRTALPPHPVDHVSDLSGRKRGLAMGVNSLGFSFGPMVGPSLAAICWNASWRTVFYINVPVGLIGLLLAYLVLPYPRRQESRRLDVLGLLSMAMFLVTFLLAMTQGREEGWDSSVHCYAARHRRWLASVLW